MLAIFGPPEFLRERACIIVIEGQFHKTMGGPGILVAKQTLKCATITAD